MNRLDRGIIVPAHARAENLATGFVRSSTEAIQGTTSFFREPSSLKTVVERLAPKFGSQITVATVGCSTGEEVYSLLLEAKLNGWGNNFSVDGYEYREDRLARARSATYDYYGRYLNPYMEAIERQVTPDVKMQQKAAGFTIPADLQEGASFHLHDITISPLPQTYPIILCTNVLYHYYLDNGRVSKETILDNLASSLELGGFLVLEGIGAYGGPGAEKYGSEIESHPAFRSCNDLGIPQNNNRSIETARVLQRVA